MAGITDVSAAIRSRVGVWVGTPTLTAFVGGAFLSSIGTGLFATIAAIYFVTDVGLDPLAVGLSLSIGATAGMVLAGPLGRVADRAGLRGTLFLVIVIRAIAYGGLAFCNSLAAYALLVILAAAGDLVTPGLQQALVGEVAGTKRRRAMATLRAVRNVGLTLGVLTGGFVLASGSDYAARGALGINGLSYLLVALAVRSLPAIERPASNELGQKLPSAARDLRFLTLTVSNGLVLIHDSVLLVLLPLWIVTRTDLPHGMLAQLLILNTIGTVLLQAWLPGRASKWSSGYWITAATFVASCACFASAEMASSRLVVASLAILAVLLLTVAENVHAVAAWDLSFALAPKGRESEYLSVFQLGMGIKSIVGPTLVTGLVLPGAIAGWALISAVVVAGVGMSLLSGRSMVRRSVEPPLWGHLDEVCQPKGRGG